MTIWEVLDAFTFYGLDIAVLAVITTAAVQLLKLTLMKNCQKKILTFLPFIIGSVLYAAYAALSRLDATFLVTGYVDVLEHGFSVGALSTIIYVWYEQFIRKDRTGSAAENVIATLIEGYVPAADVTDAATRIADAIEKDVTGDGAKKAEEILSGYCSEISEKDLRLLSKLIIETLAHMNTQT